MSSRSAPNDLMTASVAAFSRHVGGLDGENLVRLHRDLEGTVLIGTKYYEAVAGLFNDWYTRVREQRSPYDSDEGDHLRGLLVELKRDFDTVYNAVKEFERRTGKRVACADHMYIARLDIETLLRRPAVPTAPASAAFEAWELEDEDADAFAAMPARP